jgi:ABC-type polysaccharide/polyol phosphate transport system ATPase subunit
MKELPIHFDKVHKYFFLQHQKTVKELIQALFKKQKTLERVHALNNISFQIQRGEAVGILGRNGAGKSTLLKLIAGVSRATEGTISVKGRVSPLIELGAGFHPELTGAENVYLNGVILGLKESYIRERFNDIVAFAEIQEFIDTPVKYYSSGMYMRLAFSVALFVEPEILLIDEILSVGDSAFQEKCMKKMNEFKKNDVTIIFVSHDLTAINRFCDRALYLRKGELAFDGPTKDAVKLYTKHLDEI